MTQHASPPAPDLLAVHAVAWSPATDALAVGSQGFIALWSSEGARVVKGAGAPPTYVVAFSPDGAVLGAGTEAKAAKLMTRAGAPVAKLAGDSGAVTHLSFDPAGGHVVAGRALWDLEGHAIARKRFSMRAVHVGTDRVASAGPDHDADRTSPALWILVASTGEVVSKAPLEAPLRHVTSDGGHVAVADDAGRVTVFRADGQPAGGFTRFASGHMVSGLALSGDLVASGGYGDAEVWITGLDGARRATVPGYAPPTQGQGLAFAPRGGWLAGLGGTRGAQGGGDRVWLRHLDTGRTIHLLATRKAWLAVDDEGRYAGTAALDPAAKIADPTLLAGVFA